MFNFNLMNRALNDSNLSDKAFRMLYTIINYCSLKNSNSVEVHNAHLMSVLNISERWVRKITNELVEKGYITKKVNGTSQNKLANTYTLIDVEVNDTPTDLLCNDINKDAQKFPLTDRGNNKGNKSDVQKFPLKNNNKINKKNNIFLSNDINKDAKNVTLTDDANIDGSSDGRIGILKNNIKINKKYNIFLSNNINIPDTDIDNINVDNTDEVFLSNFMKVDNIVDNSNTGSENLRIEENNINNSNENDMNTPTKSLEDILTEQSDEFNSIIQFMNDSVVDTDEVNTSNNFMNISVEEQKRYQRLFNKCKSQIEIWMKTHEYSCVSMFDAYFEAIHDMYDQHLISVKQWDAAQRYLFQRFQNLRNGYFNYIQKKNKTISSNEINENNSPRPQRQQNGQIEEVV